MSVAQNPTNIPAGLQRRGTTTATLVIPSRTNHRRTLEDIYVKDGVSGFVDISIGNVTFNRIYDNLAQALFLAGLDKKYENRGFLWYLKQKIPDMPLPTATEDEAITIARDSTPDHMDAYFADQEGGEVTDRTVPGGSLSTKKLLIINLENSADVTATGSFFFDTLDLPTGLSPFVEGTDLTTGGRRVATNTKLTLYGVAADVPKNGASKVTRVHISQDTIELFASENQEGLLVDPDLDSELKFSLNPLNVFWLDVPLVMKKDSLYTFKGDFTKVAADNGTKNTLKLFLICMVELGVAA